MIRFPWVDLIEEFLKKAENLSSIYKCWAILTIISGLISGAIIGQAGFGAARHFLAATTLLYLAYPVYQYDKHWQETKKANKSREAPPPG